jgi:hypothetical protein
MEIGSVLAWPTNEQWHGALNVVKEGGVNARASGEARLFALFENRLEFVDNLKCKDLQFEADCHLSVTKKCTWNFNECVETGNPPDMGKLVEKIRESAGKILPGLGDRYKKLVEKPEDPSCTSPNDLKVQISAVSQKKRKGELMYNGKPISEMDSVELDKLEESLQEIYYEEKVSDIVEDPEDIEIELKVKVVESVQGCFRTRLQERANFQHTIHFRRLEIF